MVVHINKGYTLTTKPIHCLRKSALVSTLVNTTHVSGCWQHHQFLPLSSDHVVSKVQIAPTLSLTLSNIFPMNRGSLDVTISTLGDLRLNL